MGWRAQWWGEGRGRNGRGLEVESLSRSLGALCCCDERGEEGSEGGVMANHDRERSDRRSIQAVVSQPNATSQVGPSKSGEAPKAPEPWAHPEKPPFGGAAFKIVDGQYVRLRNENLPYPRECVAFLVRRFREDRTAWQRFVDETMIDDRPEDWIEPISKRCFQYYPETGSGGGNILGIVEELLALMDAEARSDPSSYRASDVVAHFQKVAAAKIEASNLDR